MSGGPLASHGNRHNNALSLKGRMPLSGWRQDAESSPTLPITSSYVGSPCPAEGVRSLSSRRTPNRPVFRAAEGADTLNADPASMTPSRARLPQQTHCVVENLAYEVFSTLRRHCLKALSYLITRKGLNAKREKPIDFDPALQAVAVGLHA